MSTSMPTTADSSPDNRVMDLLRQTIDLLDPHRRTPVEHDARRLQAGIRRVEKACDRHGPSSFALAALARLHAMRAIALAGSGAVADALVEAAMALDHGASDPDVHDTLRRLTREMDAICEQAAAIGGWVDPRFYPEEALLVAEARRGFGPMTRYRSSERAVRTRELTAAIGAIELWRYIGLPPPADQWPARARALERALAVANQSPPAENADFRPAWTAAIATEELLRDVPRQPVEAFLAERYPFRQLLAVS